MKCNGTSGTEMFHHPVGISASISAAESFSPGISSVVISSQTSVSCFEVDERFEHGRELARAELLVEALGEALEIDVGRIHVRGTARAAAPAQI